MTTRIMQQVSSSLRPLSFDPNGSPTVVLATSETPWAGLPFEVHRTSPGELSAAGPAHGELGLIVFLDGVVDMLSTTRGRDSSHRMLPGTTLFMSGDSPSSVRVSGSATVAAVPLSPEWFQRVELEHSPSAFEGLSPLMADANVRDLLNLMRREVGGGAAAGRLYADSLSVALLTYVLDRLSSPRLGARGRLSEAQRRQLSRHIRDRLGEDLALNHLAALVGVGTRQFLRLFQASFGVTPHRYVLNQRLDEGARCLVSTGRDIAEIALSLGFSSQSHFSSAFRKRFAQSPREYAFEHRRPRWREQLPRKRHLAQLRAAAADQQSVERTAGHPV